MIQPPHDSSNPNSVSLKTLQALAEKFKKRYEPYISQVNEEIKNEEEKIHEIVVHTNGHQSHSNETTDRNGNLIQYNARQQEFVSRASSGESCILIGAA